MRLQAAQSDFGSGSIALFALSGWVFDGSRSLQTHILNESLPTCASVLLALASYARPAVLPQQSSLGSSQLALARATALVTARVKNTSLLRLTPPRRVT